MKLRIQVFDRKSAGDKEMKTVAEFTAATEPRTLTDCGVNLRPHEGRPRSQSNASRPDTQVSVLVPPSIPGTPPPPLDTEKDRAQKMDELLQSSPVQMTILYNGAPQTIDGGALKTPTAGTVAFRLKNVDPKTTYGVVLKINGENSIERQRMDDLYCRKWVIALAGKEITVRRFPRPTTRAAASSRCCRRRSRRRRRSILSEDKVGLIQMVLFRATDKDNDAFVRKEEKRDLPSKSISHGFPLDYKGAFSPTASRQLRTS